MANYAVSDLTRVLRAGEFSDWEGLLGFLEQQDDGDPTDGLSSRDREELLIDLRRLRESGQPFIASPGDLYRAALAQHPGTG
jgi:hypothetical protein